MACDPKLREENIRTIHADERLGDLFHPQVDDRVLKWSAITPVQAARAIKGYLMTGTVDWAPIATAGQYCGS